MKKLFLNVLLSIASVAFTLIVCELLLDFNLHRLPLKFHGYLPSAVRVLAQSSKEGRIPQNYMALVGDSYAQGYGDWLLSANDWTNPDFASHHVIHRLTGRDVVSFGHGGHGSMAGIAGTPIKIFHMLNQTWFFKIRSPERVIVYFFEGNDLNNNLDDLGARFVGKYDMNRIFEPDYFRRYLEETVIGPQYVRNMSARLSWDKNLMLLYMFQAMIRQEPMPEILEEEAAPGDINRITVNGQEKSIPDHIQSPAMELSVEEVDLALYGFSQSVRYLGEHFPEVALTVVYIPSPPVCYSWASPRISIHSYHNRDSVYPAVQIQPRSLFIRAKMKAWCLSAGVDFYDATEVLQQAAGRELIHGPLDWMHLNRKGYEVLGASIADHIRATT